MRNTTPSKDELAEFDRKVAWHALKSYTDELHDLMTEWQRLGLGPWPKRDTGWVTLAARYGVPCNPGDDERVVVARIIGAAQARAAGPSKSAPPTNWEPPDTHVGAKAICGCDEFKKRGLPIPRSTLQGWEKRDTKAGILEVVRAPDSHESYYPRAWVAKRIHRWNPHQNRKS